MNCQPEDSANPFLQRPGLACGHTNILHAPSKFSAVLNPADLQFVSCLRALPLCS